MRATLERASKSPKRRSSSRSRCAGDGHRFKSPQLWSAQIDVISYGAGSHDISVACLARVGLGRLSGNSQEQFLARLLAANFRFQGCCLPRIRARPRTAILGSNHDT